MKFFRYFPSVPYRFQSGDSTFSLDLTNITIRFSIMERLKQHVTVLYDYIVQDGERPDTVANKLYGSPDHTWIVLLVNNILSLYDWPLHNAEFDRYIKEKYGSLAAAQARSIYKTTDGYVVDAVSYMALPAAQRATTVSCYDDELSQNEAKRRIRVIPAEFVEPLVLELRKTLS
jgi:hypothetical protein